MLKDHVVPVVIVCCLQVSIDTLSPLHCYTYYRMQLLLLLLLQVAAATICIGELSSQLMGAIGKRKAGTAASVLRMSQLAAILLVPFVHGMIVPHHDVVSLCVMSAAISGGAVGLVKKFGSSMVFSSEYLPGFSAKFD